MSIVVRLNGAFQVYHDFSLVNEFFNPLLQCVDIESDFDQFYFKFVRNVDKVTESTKISRLDLEIRSVRHNWRNRMGFSTMKLIR